MALGFTQRFGYAVHALCYIAYKPQGELTTMPELADWLKKVWPGSSDAYLSNVIQRLARSGILRSHRGVAGGYSLARSSKEISLRDVLERLEGVDLDRCSLSLESECPAGGHCRIQRRLRKLEEGYLKSLAAVSLAELTRDVGVSLLGR